jgi:hypothetical protein
VKFPFNFNGGGNLSTGTINQYEVAMDTINQYELEMDTINQ